MHGLSSVDISYNELEGPLPNSRAFHDAHIEALQGKKGLCGNIMGLQPCKAGHISKKGNKSFSLSWEHFHFFFFFENNGTLSLVLVFLGIFFILKGRAKSTKKIKTHMRTRKKCLQYQLLMEEQCTRKYLTQPRVFMLSFALGKDDTEPSIKPS